MGFQRSFNRFREVGQSKEGLKNEAYSLRYVYHVYQEVSSSGKVFCS